MHASRDIREQVEQAAVKRSGLNSKEQAEYWFISRKYDELWDETSPEHCSDILDCIYQWQRFMQDGLGPIEANQKVLEWLNAHSETP